MIFKSNSCKLISILLLWLNIEYFSNAHVIENQNQTNIRVQRYTRCRIDQFVCRDGSCISDGLQCNGVDDCLDSSDETTECKYVPCNRFFAYQCDYGACVKKGARCNGITECKDSSDERGCIKLNPIPSQTSCGVTKFICKSGECIDNEKLCDGYGDCRDNSDETPECAAFSCGSNAYRCKYGACAVKNARCNGIRECFDGSDEQGCASSVPILESRLSFEGPSTSVSFTPSPGSCLVPKVPTNGVYLNSNSEASVFRQGDYAPNLHALITKCDRNYKITPPNKSYPVCIDGKWTSTPLECARSCLTIASSKSKSVSCKFNGTLLDSCEDPIDGTVATIKCESSYESQSTNLVRWCIDGTWDYQLPECQPVCGQKPTTKTSGKQITKQADSPWHVGIYANDDRKTYLCGGSILSERVIVTGAHCLTNTVGTVLPKENYLIAAGKHYRSFGDERDPNAQYALIRDIYIPNRYKGSNGYYEADIAVLLLSTPLSYSPNVQAVCVDWNNEYESELISNNKGLVVGWNYAQKNDASSLELKEITVPYVSFEQCVQNVPESFKKFLTHDKMCAGYLSKGVAVCQGDSGGGITFQRKNERHYIKGVLSTSPVSSSGQCDFDQYAAYTLISKYLDFIKAIESNIM